MDENRRRTIAQGLIDVIDRLAAKDVKGALNNVPLAQDIDTIVCHAGFLKELLWPIANEPAKQEEK